MSVASGAGQPRWVKGLRWLSLACSETKGVQSLTEFNGTSANLETSISGGAYEQSGQSGTGTLALEKANEIW
jgi:hypothetical protein